MTFDQPCVGKRSRLTSVAGAALLVLATAGLGGCQTTSSVDTIMTGSTQPASLKGTAEAAKRWEADPGNVKHGLHYAGLLKGIGQTDKALSVIGELVTRNPANGNLLTIYGKELAQAGRSGGVSGRAAAPCLVSSGAPTGSIRVPGSSLVSTSAPV